MLRGQGPRLEGMAQCTQSANTSQHDRSVGRWERRGMEENRRFVQIVCIALPRFVFN